ncbi:hypothetical protein Geob_3671 [Geotalea daltonii FRC-32]|uniref:Uncharacterized protein n=1 Tax=Geotalea daltonii (strain DSM 22248 / JCM 15807 / FRC-32) TaxID=316067 RepID=B9M6Z0_GEODF|nr:hypothetical protein [Geotalea daltonii]ACM22011.1 hypothetical protein Geob_3671 [Geotalea daltonii FRC-32]
MGKKIQIIAATIVIVLIASVAFNHYNKIISYNNIVMKVAFNNSKNDKDNSLLVLKLPTNGTNIFFNKRVVPKSEFFTKYKKFIEENETIKEEKIVEKQGREILMLSTIMKSSSLMLLHISIPKESTTILFTGNAEDFKGFEDSINNLIFKH